MQSMFTETINGYQLSPQQKHLWYLQQQVKNKQVYRVQCAVLIQGNLAYPILETALTKIIAKHEIFRTEFPTLTGMDLPLQVIHEQTKLWIAKSDFTKLENEQQTIKIEKLFSEIDLQNDHVLNTHIVTLSPVKHILLIAIPAIYADTLSIHHLVFEIGEAYTACLNQQELSVQPLQYADIAAWQNEVFETEDGQLAIKYWHQQNIANLPNIQLPGEKYPPETAEFQPQNISLNISNDTLAKLQSIATNNAVDISTVLLACWQILLWRLTGEYQINIATYFHGRNYEELEPVIGLLAKYIPVGISLEHNYKFTDVIKQLEINFTEVSQWQDSFSWEQVINSQKLSFLPCAFEFNCYPPTYLASDISFSIYKQYACLEAFKIKLSCQEGNNSLIADFHYDADLFTQEDITDLAKKWQTLLSSISDNSETVISQLEILSLSERQKILVDFNATQTEYSQYQSIHQLFEQQVAITPNQPAVVFEDQQLTYAELNTRANQIAHYLKTVGVGAETIVALCVERSLEMCVGLLGILKAGGAYLPLDPLLPNQRLAYMLEDAGCAVILTQQHLAKLFCEPEIPILNLDSNWDAIAPSDTNLPCETTPENLVYVIYTSGSTGKPKGVAVEHQQLLNYVQSIIEKLDLPVGSSFATVSTFAADLGNTVIFPALCTGGCLHIISQERATNPEALLEYCDRYPIDCIKIVPSHLTALLSASQPQKILPQKRLILGGEALSSNLVATLHQYTADCQIINHYGPSETTVGVCTYTLSPGKICPSNTVPIGSPLANTQIYILDQYLQPVPIGVTGELYIGGNNLARGYINHPELTNEKFIYKSFENSQSVRLYKTGDLGRYLPNGNIEFLGRADQQVKIRGFRIEITEIESVLQEHDGIRETKILAREDELNHQRLVAYFVPNQESEVLTTDLRDFLKAKLPDYMIPSAFVQLKAFPLTVNGKIDHQALPAPENIKPELAGKFVAPRNSIEEAIAKIWSGVLKLKQVGIYDNFFELGGDSIISIQIIARLNQAGLQLTPKQLFDYPTIAELATVASSTSAVKAEQTPVTGFVPLTPIQHWFFEQNLSELHHWNQSLILEIPPEIVPDLLEQALQYVQQHHDALRLQFIQQKSHWQQINLGIEQVKKITIVHEDLTAIPPEKQEDILQIKACELQASLNLAAGSLMQVALFNLGQNQAKRLLIVIHHLAVDGISWRILLEDLQQAYQQLLQNEAVQLPLKTTSFKRWSEFLHDYAQSSKLQPEIEYWLTTASKFIAPLPIDYPDGDNIVELANKVLVSLSVEETKALLQDLPIAYHTQINDVLLTALVQTFTQWTGGNCLLVDLEGHGRESINNNINLTRTVGWFTSIFPVVLKLNGISQPIEALQAIKEQLQNLPNRGIGYGVLRYLNQTSLTTQLQSLPKAEIRFNYLGQLDQILPESSMFKHIKQTVGNSRSLRSHRRYLIDINGFVLGGQLQMEWTYSEQIHQRSTIAQLAQGFMEELRSLLALCQSGTFSNWTSAEFPEANLSQQDLEQFLAKINQGSAQ
ncbi:non-ribosomal peptide synthetase [Nodularia sp. UHCC 0506]|uniref:non-ribosomal peptide synthetase n=1 Tax=Nodularia sp. UHCC 0506 TaxID=3110243 RepID=UPI002B215338|nr:non-ribosomal peptide synthetase [Nodularia sp. UHCC 0506]MEA5516075.1 amino acid adenylation domain-containing protein [Nodularia sp. UHCC 0506]